MRRTSCSIRLDTTIGLRTLSGRLNKRINFRLLMIVCFLLLRLRSTLGIFFRILFLSSYFLLNRLRVSLRFLGLLFLLLRRVLTLVLLLRSNGLWFTLIEKRLYLRNYSFLVLFNGLFYRTRLINVLGAF